MMALSSALSDSDFDGDLGRTRRHALDAVKPVRAAYC